MRAVMAAAAHGTGRLPHTIPNKLLSSKSSRGTGQLRKSVLLLRIVNVRERMGSGGPRGLQIPRSGASGVRGGFDSHAFPPVLRRRALLAVALAGCAVTAPAARAAGVGAFPGPGAPQLQVVGTAGPAAAQADSARRRVWHEQPRFVMARSLLIPGWGQLHNHAWLKAAAVAGAEGWLGVRIVNDQHVLDRLFEGITVARDSNDQTHETELVNEYNTRLDQRLGRQWMFAGLLAYALVDAYVDAHFRSFDLEFQHDPALPAGPPAAPLSSGRGGARVSLALRWDF